jgi:hypothetical protein
MAAVVEGTSAILSKNLRNGKLRGQWENLTIAKARSPTGTVLDVVAASLD